MVTVFCNSPDRLLRELKEGVASGTIETWRVDSDGDFTHVPPQWVHKAWFRPHTKSDRLVFHIFGSKGVNMTRTVYAVYHGRFIEMLLTHLDLKFSQVTASALPAESDRVRSSSS